MTSRQLAERTRSLDPVDKGLSHSDLVRLAIDDEPLNPHAINLLAATSDEFRRPKYLVEYRAAQLRRALDRQSGDSS